MAKRHVWTDAMLNDRELVFVGDERFVPPGADALTVRLPGRIEVIGEGDFDVVLGAELSDDNAVVVSEVTVRRRADGPGITSAALKKIPIRSYVEDMMRTPPVGIALQRVGDEYVSGDAVTRIPASEMRGRAREDDLQHVAEILREAPAGSRVEEVRKRMNVSVPTAKRLIRDARAAGFAPHTSRSAPKSGAEQS